MTRILYRISRGACPAADRPWLDALFAEIDAVESGRARFVWLLGAVGLLADRIVRRLDARLVLAAAVCLGLSITSSVLWFLGFEALALDDDLYMAGAAAFAVALVGLSILQMRRPVTDAWQ
jgi:hypothetical protein